MADPGSGGPVPDTLPFTFFSTILLPRERVPYKEDREVEPISTLPVYQISRQPFGSCMPEVASHSNRHLLG